MSGTEYVLDKSLLFYFNFYYGPKIMLFAPWNFNFPLFKRMEVNMTVSKRNIKKY